MHFYPVTGVGGDYPSYCSAHARAVMVRMGVARFLRLMGKTTFTHEGSLPCTMERTVPSFIEEVMEDIGDDVGSFEITDLHFTIETREEKDIYSYTVEGRILD